METRTVSEHAREHLSLLANREKEILIRIARLLPRCVSSDHLTLLGLVSLSGAGFLYWAARWNKWYLPAVVVALALNWFGDSLDGTLARVRGCQRPRYGFYVDHVLDMVGVLFLLGGLSLSGYMSPLVALGLLVAYLMVAAEVFLATCVQGVFRLSTFRVGPTELRILLGVGTLYLLHSPTGCIPGLGAFLLFDIGGTIGIAGLLAAFAVSAVRNTRDLYLAEPLDHQGKAGRITLV